MRASKWFVLLSVLLYLGTVGLVVVRERTQHQALEDEVAESVRTAGQTRHVFLFGSSNVLFGLSAAQLGAAFGVPTFNLARIKIGDRIDALFTQRVQQNVRAGDVLVFSDRSWRAAVYRPAARSAVRRLIEALFGPVPPLVPYLRDALAEHQQLTARGDLTVYPPAGVSRVARQVGLPAYDPAALDNLRDQIAMVRARGACPIAVLTPLLIDGRDRALFDRAQQQLQQRLQAAGLADSMLELPMLLDNPALFWDHEHLNAAGRAVWTAAVLEEIGRRKLCGLGAVN